MKIAVVADHHYYADENGNVYVPTVYGYSYWSRYLDVFEEITVVCRGNVDVPFDKEKMLLASGKGVKFAFIPDFSGFKEMALRYVSANRELKKHLSSCDFAFVRVPSPLSRLAVNYLIRHKKLFACEVAADPAECFGATPFPAVVKGVMKRHCQQACLHANGATYVTREALQKRYPSHARLHGASESHFETYYSNANLPAWFYEHSRSYEKKPDTLELIHVANHISGRGKGHYVCVDIVKKLQQMHLPVRLTFVGDGPGVPALKDYAREQGVTQALRFAGRMADAMALRDAYLQADILLLPSRTEGLPRCMVEAMACSLVCLGSDAGGIPELLKPEDMCAWQDAEGFARRIGQLWEQWHQMQSKSAQNRLLAEQYSADVLKERRDAFYRKAKQLCKEGEQL